MKTLIRTNACMLLTALALPLGSATLQAQDSGESAGNETKPTLTVKGTLHDQLVGYWAPNEEFFFNMVVAEMEKSGQANPEVLEAMKGTMKQMIGSMVMEFTRTGATMISPQGKESSTYKITSTNKETGTLLMEVTSKTGKVEKSTIILKGDSLKVTATDGKAGFPDMMFDRITEAEFKKRSEGAGKLLQGLKDSPAAPNAAKSGPGGTTKPKPAPKGGE